MTPSRTDSLDQRPGHGSLWPLVPAPIAPREAEPDRIVIVGGGFAGTTLAQPLGRTLGDRAEVLRAGRDPLPVADDGGHVVGMLGALEAIRALEVGGAEGGGGWRGPDGARRADPRR